MMHTQQKVKCLICLNLLKQGDTVWFLPCPTTDKSNRHKGSVFGGTLTSDPSSQGLNRSVSSTQNNGGASLVSNAEF